MNVSPSIETKSFPFLIKKAPSSSEGLKNNIDFDSPINFLRDFQAFASCFEYASMRCPQSGHPVLGVVNLLLTFVIIFCCCSFDNFFTVILDLFKLQTIH